MPAVVGWQAYMFMLLLVNVLPALSAGWDEGDDIADYSHSDDGQQNV